MEPACLRESPAGSRGHLTEKMREDRTDEDREADGESEETEKERKSVDCPVFGKQTDEELDPRIQEELERLNEASEEINKMELELQEVRTSHRRIMGESVLKLKAMSSDLGSCIEKARPYYEARRKAKEAQQETQKAALSFERAVSMHSAAREMVHVAEQGLTAIRSLDPTWQEMLNHATLKVNEAEEERIKSELEHMRVTQQCQEAEACVQELQKTLRRSIIKSKSYFELKAQFNDILEELKSKILLLEKNISKAKLNYSSSLRQLERISEEIHAQRELNQSNDESSKTCGGRSSPLGAEANVDTESGVTVGLHRANNWSDGKVAVANTREWVEMHCNSQWGDTPTSDSLSIKSSHTIMSDLGKCDSVEHLAHLSSDISLTTEGHEEDDSLGQKRDISEDFLKKHNRSVSL